METTIERKRENTNSQKSSISYDLVFKDLIERSRNKSLKDLKGKISFRDDYNYKLLRS